MAVSNEPLDRGLLALRLGVGAIFAHAGYQKVTGIDAVQGFFGSLGIPAPEVMAWVVALVELLGGIGILVGFLARTAGIALAVNMAVAVVLATWPREGWDSSRLEVLLLLGSLAITFAGTGGLTIPRLAGRPAMDGDTWLWGRLRSR